MCMKWVELYSSLLLMLYNMSDRSTSVPATSEVKTSRWILLKTFSYGLITGLVCLRAVRFYQKWRLPKTHKIQSAVLPMLRANTEVRAHIGTSLKPGLLSTYAYTGGMQWRLPYMDKEKKWTSLIPVTYEPWSVQMLFQVLGEKGAGLVSLETKSGSGRGRGDGNPVSGLKLLVVDFNDGQRLVIKDMTIGQRESVIEYEHLKDK